MYRFEGMSERYLLALLYSHKYGVEEAIDKYMIPERLFREIYDTYGSHIYDESFRLSIIEELLTRGVSPEDIAEAIDWRDFEVMVSKYLEGYGYTTFIHYRIPGSRLEIDILGIREEARVIMVVECKNWDKVIYKSQLERIHRSIIDKAVKLCGLDRFKGYSIAPIVVSLRHGKIKVFNNIPIIPISMLKAFLDMYPPRIIVTEFYSLPC